MMRALVLLAAVLLAACAGARNKGATPPELWRLSDYAYASQCTPERAVRVKISDITTNMMRYHRTCVTIEGILYSGRLFETRDDLYRVSTRNLRGKRSDADVDIRMPPELRTLQGFHLARITGVAADCAFQHQEWELEAGIEYATTTAATATPADVWIFIDHSCRDDAPSRIYPASITLDPVTNFERMAEATRGPDLGNLLLLPQESELYARAARIADNFMAAVKRRDRAEVMRQFAGGWGDEEDQRRQVNEVLGGSGPPEREVRYATEFTQVAEREGVQRVIFGEVPPATADATFIDMAADFAFVCYCTESDCAGRWPIDTIDVGTKDGRPYICIEIFDEGLGAAAKIGVYTDQFGLSEPERSPTP